MHRVEHHDAEIILSQAVMRGFVARKKYQRKCQELHQMKIENEASIIIQVVFLNVFYLSFSIKLNDLIEKQRWWRKFLQRRAEKQRLESYKQNLKAWLCKQILGGFLRETNTSSARGSSETT